MITKKKLLKCLLVITCLCISTFIWANEPVLVLDARNSPTIPRNFRSTNHAEIPGINWTGFAELHMAGGAQFSKLGLTKILETLHTKQLTIIDLRQESHGFLNGNAISWYGQHDASNAGLTPELIEEQQKSLLDAVTKYDDVTVFKILSKTVHSNIDKKQAIDFAVHQVSTEADVAASFNLGYQRLYVQDFHAPQAIEVDKFIEIVKNIHAGQWIYFHCRAGRGRSTTFMTMFDMMRNAKKVSFEDILARQAAIGGKNFMELPPQNAFKYKPAIARLQFLKHFYEYAKTNQDDFKTSYSEWSKLSS